MTSKVNWEKANSYPHSPDWPFNIGDEFCISCAMATDDLMKKDQLKHPNWHITYDSSEIIAHEMFELPRVTVKYRGC